MLVKVVAQSSLSCSMYHVPLSAWDVFIKRNSSPAALSLGMKASAGVRVLRAELAITTLQIILAATMR
jgi:hypothetical protein